MLQLYMIGSALAVRASGTNDYFIVHGSNYGNKTTNPSGVQLLPGMGIRRSHVPPTMKDHLEDLKLVQKVTGDYPSFRPEPPKA